MERIYQHGRKAEGSLRTPVVEAGLRASTDWRRVIESVFLGKNEIDRIIDI